MSLPKPARETAVINGNDPEWKRGEVPHIPTSSLRSSVSILTLFGHRNLNIPTPCSTLQQTSRGHSSIMDQKRDANHVEEPKRFEPKTPVNLNPPKDDPITLDYLAKCDGMSIPDSPF